MKRTKLDEFMREIGVTNTGLAAVTGLHRKTIQEAREGLVKSRYSTLRKINKVLEQYNKDKEIRENEKEVITAK